MTTNTKPFDEESDLKLRRELQEKLQNAIRRSAPASEMRKIEGEIEALNRRIESYKNREILPR